MAVPSYATNLNDVVLEMASTTGWSLISSGGGGANSLTAPETDDFIQGANCISRNPWTSANIRGMVYNSAETVTANEAVFIWWKSDVAQALDTQAAGGIQCLVGSGTGALECYYVDGSDTYARGGWKCSPVDPAITGDTQIGAPSGATDYFGVRWSIAASGPNKGFPYKIDAMRHGSNIEITAGEIANPATFEALSTYADDITRRWGIVQPTSTGMTQQGLVSWGTAATACYSRVANRTLVFLDTQGFTATTFTAVEFRNVGSDIVWDNVSIASLDTLNRGTIEVFNNAPTSLTSCNISDIDTTVDGGTNSVWDSTAWRRCNAVTAAGGTFLNCQVLASTVAADAGAFVYNEAVNPDGVLDGMTFTQGAAAHHAIEFGASIPSTMTLNNMTFTDFDADTTNGAALNFLDTTGTITVSLIGTTTPTYKSAGATIVFVTNPVTVSVTTVTTDGTIIPSVNVWLPAVTGTGLPTLQATTIVNSGTTATATTTGVHGLATNDQVEIVGASLAANNGVFTVVVTSTTEFTYTMGSTPGSSPTGSITTTFVFLYGLTNGSGIISMTRSLPATFTVSGHGRKGSAAPYYKQGPITGSVTSASGATFIAVMVAD